MSLAYWLYQHPSQLLIGVLVGITTLLIYHVCKLYSNRGKYPPGPFPLPFVGNILLFRGKNRHIHHILEDLSKEYGPIYTFYFGHTPHVIVTDKDLSLTVMQKHQFAGRPYVPLFDEMFKPGSVDITSSDFNPEWEVLRKVAHLAMRKYAVSERLSTIVADVVDQVVERWRQMPENHDINLKFWIDKILSNIFASSAFGGRFDLDDAELEKWLAAHSIEMDYSAQIMLFGFVPWLKYLYLPLYRKLKEAVKYQQDFSEKRFREHVKTFDGLTIRDFTDAMLMAKEAEEEEEQINNEHIGVNNHVTTNHSTSYYLRDWNIINSVNTLFTAGNEGSETIILWTFLFLANYPDKQKKVQAEIEEVIGEEEIPTLDHRKKCHFTCAFIAEILRFRHGFPLNALHKATIDMELTSTHTKETVYYIPEGTTIQPFLSPGLMDKEVWGDPDCFRPERFLDIDGKFVSKPNAHYVPFSAGRRTCPGDKLALFNIFFIVARLVQQVTIRGNPKFEFALSEGPGSVDLYGDPSNTRGVHPVDYRIVLNPKSE